MQPVLRDPPVHTGASIGGNSGIPQTDQGLIASVLAEEPDEVTQLSAAVSKRIVRRHRRRNPQATPAQHLERLQEGRQVFGEVMGFSQGMDDL